MRRYATAAILAWGVLLSAGVSAPAAVTIGQVAPGGVSTTCTGPDLNADYLQPSVTSGDLYIAREAGRIVSWSTRAAAGSGQRYTLKVFRRTTDPDIFRVIAHSAPQILTPGLNSYPANLDVSSGDLIGFHEDGAANACTFAVPGDSVLSRDGNLPDGSSGAFTAVAGVRLNLEAVLDPANAFSVEGVTRDRRAGTATLALRLPNPGVVTLTGKGLKTKRPSKTTFAAGTVRFWIASSGKRRRALNRTGRALIPITTTFTPAGGEPATQTLKVRLRKRVRPDGRIRPSSARRSLTGSAR
jgi:hypothetical protein